MIRPVEQWDKEEWYALDQHLPTGKTISRSEAHDKGITDLLKVVQTARDTTITVGVQCIQIDGCPAVYTRVNFGTLQDRLSVSIHNA